MIFKFDNTLNAFQVHFNKTIFIIDVHNLEKILNISFKWKYNDTSFYPYYDYNYKKNNILEVLYNFKNNDIYYDFINNNPYDLRESNVLIYHNYNKNIREEYDVINYIQGHYTSTGREAFLMKNPIWKVKNTYNYEYLMYCEKNTIVKLCEKSYQKIIEFEKESNNNNKIIFYKNSNGYICGNNKLFIHQIIMDCYGNGKGTNTISVDHIDRDPLNNKMENLRLATHKEQQENSRGVMKDSKRARKSNAKPLPDGITQDMLKKYVTYNKECYNKEKQLYREFFRVERHPKMTKSWVTTKSGKILIMDKLKLANEVVDNLEKDIFP